MPRDGPLFSPARRRVLHLWHGLAMAVPLDGSIIGSIRCLRLCSRQRAVPVCRGRRLRRRARRFLTRVGSYGTYRCRNLAPGSSWAPPPIAAAVSFRPGAIGLGVPWGLRLRFRERGVNSAGSRYRLLAGRPHGRGQRAQGRARQSTPAPPPARSIWNPAPRLTAGRPASGEIRDQTVPTDGTPLGRRWLSIFQQRPPVFVHFMHSSRPQY